MTSINADEHPHLYRAIRDEKWIKVRRLAFRLRKANEVRQAETDISLILSTDNCTKSVCGSGLVNYCGGEFVLDTRSTLAVSATKGWEVDQDAPNHARIIGLPLHGSPKQLINDAALALAELITDFQPRPTTD